MVALRDLVLKPAYMNEDIDSLVVEFPVIVDFPLGDMAAIFARPSFQKGEPLPPVLPPPSLPAERALKKQLEQFNFTLPGSKETWQNYVMAKYFELTLDPDPKVSKPALDSLAKTSIVGLMVERQEISIVHKSTEELENALREAVERYVGKPIN